MARSKGINRRLYVAFQQMEQILRQIPADIVPWSDQELDLMSFNQVDKKSKGWLQKIQTGIVTSIYQEHLAKYAFKTSPFNSKTGLLYVYVGQYEIGYAISSKAMDIYINEQYLGQLSTSGQLKGPSGRKVIMQVRRALDNSMDIDILGRNVASIHPFKEGDLKISRMLAYQNTENIEETLIVMSICMLRNVMIAIPHPSINTFLQT